MLRADVVLALKIKMSRGFDAADTESSGFKVEWESMMASQLQKHKKSMKSKKSKKSKKKKKKRKKKKRKNGGGEEEEINKYNNTQNSKKETINLIERRRRS